MTASISQKFCNAALIATLQMLPSFSPSLAAESTATPAPTATPTLAVVVSTAPSLPLLLHFPKLPIVLTQSFEGKLIDDFSTYAVGKFPEVWRPKGENGRPFYLMAEENGHKYLKVDALHDGTSVFRPVEWDIQKYPILEWVWRPRLLPKDGNEKKQSTNDCSVAIYVVFPIHWGVPDTLKYTWSTTLPVGTEFYNGMFNKNKTRVLRSGSQNLGQWHVERRNILADYNRRFDHQPSNPIGIGVITDADNTGSESAGDYAYFKMIAAESAQTALLSP